MTDLINECAKEAAKPLLDAIKEVCSYIKQYEDNVNELQTKADELRSHWEDINEKVNLGLNKGEVLNNVAKEWLKKVENLLEKDKKLKKLMDERYRKQKDQCCFGLCHVSPSHRYKCSKKAQGMTKLLGEYIDEIPKDAVTRPQSVEEVQSIIDEYKKYGLKSREKLVNDVLQKLLDDAVDVVGLYGQEGVGKTRLVREISEKWNDKTRGWHFMVEIRAGGDIKDIQEQIVSQVKNVAPPRQPSTHSLTVEERKNYVYDALCGINIFWKIFLCLDNIWEKIDLHKVGIPEGSQIKLLVSSRKKSVCEEMGAKACNMFEFLRLSENEARHLFWETVFIKENMISAGYLHVADKLLSKCGGFPHAIISLVRVLSDKTLLYWECFTAELERQQPSIRSRSSQQLYNGWCDDDDNVFYSILETSYKLLSDEERMMMLVCCLFPQGPIPIQDLMRFAIGLGLIQWVNTLSDAHSLSNTWADRLISSNLIVKDADYSFLKGRHVKISDRVRRYAILMLAKDGPMCVVEAFPRWLLEETCQKCSAISLMFGADHSFLNGLNSRKLQILILDKSQPDNQFSDSFFEWMENLKVLVLKGMRLHPQLSKSVGKLKRSLRTLHLEDCKLGDITVIGELSNLVLLSLSKSQIDELPQAMGNLCKLRLLDLSMCEIVRKGILANVLSKLSQLEGLYVLDSVTNWSIQKIGETPNDHSDGVYAYASISELNSSKYLKVLELHLDFEHLPIHGYLQFVKNLDQFYIHIGEGCKYEAPVYSRVLRLRGINVSSIARYNCLRGLLDKTQMLELHGIGKLQYVFHDFHHKEESTILVKNNNHDYQLPHLQHLILLGCPEIESISFTPFGAQNLTKLLLLNCQNMKFIFMEHAQVNAEGDSQIIRFPGVKKIFLCNVPALESVTGIIKCPAGATSDDDHIQGRQVLFNTKMTFPLLEDLILYSCDGIVQVWEVNCKEMSYYSSFKNMKKLEINTCNKLEILGSLSIATALVQLKRLSVKYCTELTQVFSGKEKTEVHELFPSLEVVILGECPKLKMFLSTELNQVLELSTLTELTISECPEMQAFSSGPFKAPKLTQIEFDTHPYSIQEIKDINSFLQHRFHSHTKPSEEIVEEKST